MKANLRRGDIFPLSALALYPIDLHFTGIKVLFSFCVTLYIEFFFVSFTSCREGEKGLKIFDLICVCRSNSVNGLIRFSLMKVARNEILVTAYNIFLPR